MYSTDNNLHVWEFKLITLLVEVNHLQEAEFHWKKLETLSASECQNLR